VRQSLFLPQLDSFDKMPSRSRKADTRGVHYPRIIPQNSNFIYNKFIKKFMSLRVAQTRHEAISSHMRRLLRRKNRPPRNDIIKRRNYMRRMLGFMIGIAVGSLVGSTIALLMAPESGDQLRSQIRERGQNFFSDVRSAADERRIELRQRLDEMRAPRDVM
jgi:hypothetical protein